MRAAKVQASLRIRAVSPEPSLLAHTSSESRGTFRQKARSLAPLNGWTCAVKICHDGMLEDTNSLDGAQIMTVDLTVSIYIITEFKMKREHLERAITHRCLQLRGLKPALKIQFSFVLDIQPQWHNLQHAKETMLGCHRNLSHMACVV